MYKLITTLFALLLLVGCSSKPVLPTEGVDLKLNPGQVPSAPEPLNGARVLWGGVIITSTNLEGRTRLEILSYPLDSTLRPQTGKSAGSRFLAFHPGYLETADYAAGREISMVGTVGDLEEAKLGEHRYRYPTIHTEQIHLWPKKEAGESKSKVHFGIGVIFSN